MKSKARIAVKLTESQWEIVTEALFEYAEIVDDAVSAELRQVGRRSQLIGIRISDQLHKLRRKKCLTET